MFPNAFALAKRLNKTLIAFDLEHTGGSSRGITEFGAIVVTPESEIIEYTSLVKPRPECAFEPYVCRLTGIWPRTVADAPGWAAVLEQFVQPNKDAIWCGFASRSSDMPIIRKESEAVGYDASILPHLDLMWIGELKGKLTERVAALWPDLPMDGAHRALADARFTLWLLEGLLKQGEPVGDKIVSGELCLSQHIPSPDAVPQTPRPRRPFDASFLVKGSGASRNGEPWTESEKIWLKSQFKKGKTPVDLSQANGRSPYAVAWRLFSEGLLTATARENFKHA